MPLHHRLRSALLMSSLSFRTVAGMPDPRACMRMTISCILIFAPVARIVNTGFGWPRKTLDDPLPLLRNQRPSRSSGGGGWCHRLAGCVSPAAGGAQLRRLRRHDLRDSGRGLRGRGRRLLRSLRLKLLQHFLFMPHGRVRCPPRRRFRCQCGGRRGLPCAIMGVASAVHVLPWTRRSRV